MPSQLPTDDAERPAPRNLKAGAWVLLLLVAVALALGAFFWPKPAAQGPREAAPTTEQNARERTPYASPHP